MPDNTRTYIYTYISIESHQGGGHSCSWQERFRCEFSVCVFLFSLIFLFFLCILRKCTQQDPVDASKYIPQRFRFNSGSHSSTGRASVLSARIRKRASLGVIPEGLEGAPIVMRSKNLQGGSKATLPMPVVRLAAFLMVVLTGSLCFRDCHALDPGEYGRSLLTLDSGRSFACTGALEELLSEKPSSPAGAAITLQLQVQPRNLNRLEAEWAARSSPDSPLFRKWLRRSEVHELVANAAATAKVLEFFSTLENVSAAVSSRDGLWVTVTASVAQVEDMFATQLFQVAEGVHRARRFTLPGGLAPGSGAMVAIVVGLIDMSVMSPNDHAMKNEAASDTMKKKIAASDSWEECCVPPCRCLNASAVAQLYSVNATAVLEFPAISTAGVFEVETYESYLPSDTTMFEQLNRSYQRCLHLVSAWTG